MGHRWSLGAAARAPCTSAGCAGLLRPHGCASLCADMCPARPGLAPCRDKEKDKDEKKEKKEKKK